MKENVVPRVGAINKDSGYSLIFNNLILRVTRKFCLLENSYFNVKKAPQFFAKCRSGLVPQVKRCTDKQD